MMARQNYAFPLSLRERAGVRGSSRTALANAASGPNSTVGAPLRSKTPSPQPSPGGRGSRHWQFPP